MVGAFDPARTREWIARYFGHIPAVELAPPADISEPRQEQQRWKVKDDPLATRPALAVAYHVPPRYTPEWYAFGLIDQVLAQGRDAWFYDELVRTRGLTGGLNAGINFGLGNMYNYKGPMLWMVSAFHDADKPADSLLAALDASIARLQQQPLDQATLDRARIKQRSALYSAVESFSGFGRADLLASFALFDDDPGRINALEAGFAAVTPELVQQTAREYLRATNRSVLVINPGRKEASR